MSSKITYHVRTDAGPYDTDEAGAWEAIGHASECPGCPSGFHYSLLLEGHSLLPEQVFPVNLATGAVLYPTTAPLAPVAERVQRALKDCRIVLASRITPTMAEALDRRIERLEAWRP